MKSALQFFIRPLTSQPLDGRMASLACYAVSILTLVAGFAAISKLQLTAGELFISIMLVLVLGQLSVLIGLVVPIAVEYEARRKR